MFGSPDDTSCVDVNEDDDSYMPTISDSDLVRDQAKHVQWHSLPGVTKSTAPKSSLPLRSIDSLIQPDGASSRSSKGLSNVKAKMKAVARFLSASKGQQESLEVTRFTEKGIPIAGRGVAFIAMTQSSDAELGRQPAIRVDSNNPAREVGIQSRERGGRGNKPALESLRERIVTQQNWQSHPPPPPRLAPEPLPRPPELASVAPHLARPPTAVTAKKRYPPDLESGLLFPRPGEPRPPRTRTATPHPAHQNPVCVVNRPLPPAPAALPTRSSSLPIDEQQGRRQQPPTSTSSRGRERVDPIQTHVDAPSNGSDETLTDTHVGDALRLERFPSLRRRANGMVDAKLLAAELDRLASLTEQRRANHRTRSASSITAADIANCSREALYNWRPSDEPAHATPSFNHHEQLKQMKPARTSVRSSSLFVESSSKESKSVKRIKHWRMNIIQAPSVVSKVASAHSRFEGEDDGISSHLTSVSRNPLSRKSVERDMRMKHAEEEGDPQKTPTVRAKRVTHVGYEAAQQDKASPPTSVKSNSNSQHPATRSLLGTNHIARLSDSQFDRLARATEGPAPPPAAPIPEEPSFSNHLLPAVSATAPTPIHFECHAQDDRRTSLDAPQTTLSVLEKKASDHIDTLDQMIRRHPDKMSRILKSRPGLMLVVLLRCKVEDRISEVQSRVGDKGAVLVDTTNMTGRKEEEKRDALSSIEKSLIGLRFDEEEEVSQPAVGQGEEQRMPEDARSVPSIVVSQHFTGHSQFSAASSITSTAPLRPVASVVADQAEEGRIGTDTLVEIGPRGEAALETIMHRLEQAGELCSVQQTLIALQDRLMSTTVDCSRLQKRLSSVSLPL